MKFEGCFTAMVTPFKEDGALDEEGLANNVRYQIESGVKGLVALGTTGESPTITADEGKKIIQIVVENAAGKVPVIIGTGTNSTAKTVEETREAKELGADAALVVSPYYNKPTQKGLLLHFTKVADTVDIPLIVYNIQGRTGVNIETPTLAKMAEHPNIVAVKEASGDINQIMDVIAALPSDFSVLSGDDSMTFPLMALGGNGVISVAANLVPVRVQGMCAAALEGDFEKAKTEHYALLPLFRNQFIETNPIPIKAAMNTVGLPAGPNRLPLCEMLPENKEKLEAALKEIGLLVKVQ